MAHNLTQREDGSTEFFSGRNTPVWHGLGKIVSGLATSKEAIEHAQLGWGVEQVPVLMDSPQGMLDVPGHFVVRRTDNFSALSIMSARYIPIQNTEAFDFADSVIGSGQAVWDTAGSIGGGRKVFMQAVLPGKLFLKSNPDDVTEKRILFMTSHDGSSALTGYVTPIRVVCQNTLNASLKNNTNQFKIYHRKNYQAKANEAAKVLELAHAYFNDLQHVMNVLAEQEVTKTYVDGFVNALIPTRKVSETGEEEVATRTENRRNEIISLFREGTGNNGKTRWDLYNAVTEYVDHKQGGRVTTARIEKSAPLANVEAEQRFERSLTGAGATLKQRAMDLLLA
jgi:phage/plasmid-like protein (TIGR03299 family)